MKADVRFGRLGAQFKCVSCGELLDETGSENLLHPMRTGWILKSLSECEFRGQMFENPFINMELKRMT